MPNNHPFMDDLTDRIKTSKNGCFLINFSIEGQNDRINIQNWMKLTIHILDGKHLHPKSDDIDHPDWDESNSC